MDIISKLINEGKSQGYTVPICQYLGENLKFTLQYNDSPLSLECMINKRDKSLAVKVIKENVAVDSYESTVDDFKDLESKLVSTARAYKIVSEQEDSYAPGVSDSSDDEDNDILTEESDYTSIPAGLMSIKDEIKAIGDKLKSVSGMTNDVEMIAVIIDLANSAYALALDVEDSIETYNDLSGEEIDDTESLD